jgi:hypothetical protein
MPTVLTLGRLVANVAEESLLEFPQAKAESIDAMSTEAYFMANL